MNISVSIHARLLNRAKARGEDFNLVLMRYTIERFLYRLSQSPAREAFCLKGALLFSLWFDSPHRPTHDADFLGLGPANVDALKSTMREICAVVVEDGMLFDPDSIKIEEIREDSHYGGLRVRLLGMLGKARCPMQLDIGYGDAITPGPEEATYPTILNDQPAPQLRVYPRATVAAEKLDAISSLGLANTRMKDYFDLLALAQEGVLDGQTLASAITATFHRRGRVLTADMLLGLSDEFAWDSTKRTQWKAFLNKNRLDAPELDEVVREIRNFVAESLTLAFERNAAQE